MFIPASKIMPKGWENLNMTAWFMAWICAEILLAFAAIWL
jgi:hypothetical protein